MLEIISTRAEIQFDGKIYYVSGNFLHTPHNEWFVKDVNMVRVDSELEDKILDEMLGKEE